MRTYTSIRRSDIFRDKPLWPDDTAIPTDRSMIGEISPCGKWCITRCVSKHVPGGIEWELDMEGAK